MNDANVSMAPAAAMPPSVTGNPTFRPADLSRFHDLESYLARRLQCPVAPYERTPDTLAQLTEAVQDDLTLSACLNARSDALDQLIVLLAHSIRSTKTHLSALGLADTSRLSSTAQSHLDALTEIALQLDLADVSPVSMQTAITHRQLEAARCLTAQIKSTQHQAICTQLAAYFDTEAAQLEQQLQDLAPLLTSRLEDQEAFAERMPVLEAKLHEYVQRLESIAQPPKEARYDEVARLAREVSELEDAIREEREQLQVLREVPPDRLLVRLKLEDTRHELEQLKRERESLLVDLARSLAPM